MSGFQQQPPPQQPPPSGYGYPPPGYGYGAPPPPRGSRLGAGVLIAIFVGVLIAIVLVAGLIVLLTQPPPPVADCLPNQPCAPQQTLPPISERSPLPSSDVQPTIQPSPSAVPSATPPGETSPPVTPGPSPTPNSDSPPALSGQTWTSATLDYSFEYDPEIFELTSEDDDTAVFGGTFFDAQVVVEATDATTSPAEMIARQLGVVDNFVIARAADTDEYDALLGPSIGYLRGEGAVFGGTLLGRDGTPVAPAGVVVLSSTDGRITVAVVLIVATPDTRLGSETHLHAVRDAADDFLKTFHWGGT